MALTESSPKRELPAILAALGNLEDEASAIAASAGMLEGSLQLILESVPVCGVEPTGSVAEPLNINQVQILERVKTVTGRIKQVREQLDSMRNRNQVG